MKLKSQIPLRDLENKLILKIYNKGFFTEKVFCGTEKSKILALVVKQGYSLSLVAFLGHHRQYGNALN